MQTDINNDSYINYNDQDQYDLRLSARLDDNSDFTEKRIIMPEPKRE